MGRTLLRSERSHSFLPFVWEKGGGGEVDDMKLGESFTWGHEWKIIAENEFSGNLNIINFKIYPNCGGIYSFKRKLGKMSGKG